VAPRWLITGVSSGIGEALAEAALDAGENVAGTVRRAQDGGRLRQAFPGQFTPLVLDMTDEKAVSHAVEEAQMRLGAIDVAVINAGRSLFGAVEETAPAEARALFEVNVFAALALARAVLPGMRARGSGRIIAMSSGCGLNAVPGLGLYSASKFALEGLMEALAAEVGPHGVQVMLVEPGAVATRFISGATSDVAGKLDAYPEFASGKDALEAYYAKATPAHAVAALIRATLQNKTLPLRLIADDGVAERARARAQRWLAELHERNERNDQETW